MRLVALIALALVACGHHGATDADGGVDARALFSATCAKCHGETGHADTPQGRLVGAKDLMRDEARQMTDAQIAQQIRAGKGKMPAFAQVFSEREIAALVREVRRRQQLEPSSGK